ncbi:hypothetical protein AAY52_03735 [Vibrio metoecus]|nr:hypothetical protein AAY52_03735 [Vibrio metoecus]
MNRAYRGLRPMVFIGREWTIAGANGRQEVKKRPDDLRKTAPVQRLAQERTYSINLALQVGIE